MNNQPQLNESDQIGIRQHLTPRGLVARGPSASLACNQRPPDGSVRRALDRIARRVNPPDERSK